MYIVHTCMMESIILGSRELDYCQTDFLSYSKWYVRKQSLTDYLAN
jgi:hypothetical protein